jgi:hypothetical protein
MTILLYADDPGAANYLAPLPQALLALDRPSRLVVSPALTGYCRDRGIAADTRQDRETPERLLDGITAAVLGTSEDPDCWGHLLAAQAKAQGIPTVGVVDMGVNAHNRFRGNSRNPLQHAPDWLAVPDATCQAAFADLGYPPERLLPLGHPHYDEVRARLQEHAGRSVHEWRAQSFPEAPAGRPLWLFLAEGVDRLAPAQSFRQADYTLHGRGDTDFRAAIALQELIDAAAELPVRPWIVLRPHPKSEMADFACCEDGIDACRIGGDPLPLLLSADLVVGMSTMLLLEAYLLRRPTLSILPRDAERHWLITLQAGLTPVVSTREALHDWLRGRSAAPTFDAEAEERVLPRGATASLARFLSGLRS